ncbi:MAG: hypothetical protein K2I79_02225 [Clostridia bacterium]|nr:hypothetical protein [Clostridia bacterium]
MKKITASVSFMPKESPDNTALPSNSDFSALNAVFSGAKSSADNISQTNKAAPSSQNKDIGHDVFALPDEYKLR